jgi:hypothetical protein
MNEYEALFAYVGVVAVVLLGGMLWSRYRVHVKRKLNLKHYREDTYQDDSTKRNHQDADQVHHASAASR